MNYLYGVQGVECSNHSVPTIYFNDLATFGWLCCFWASDFSSVEAFPAAPHQNCRRRSAVSIAGALSGS